MFLRFLSHFHSIEISFNTFSYILVRNTHFSGYKDIIIHIPIQRFQVAESCRTQDVANMEETVNYKYIVFPRNRCYWLTPPPHKVKINVTVKWNITKAPELMQSSSHNLFNVSGIIRRSGQFSDSDQYAQSFKNHYRFSCSKTHQISASNSS